MIRLDTWVSEGAQHPQRMRRFTMVTFGVPIREQVTQPRKEDFEDKESKKRSAVLRQA
jgi:hypothetical protein